jgi:hypothetical protein
LYYLADQATGNGGVSRGAQKHGYINRLLASTDAQIQEDGYKEVDITHTSPGGRLAEGVNAAGNNALGIYPMIIGIWQLIATLSVGSQHSAWIQIK